MNDSFFSFGLNDTLFSDAEIAALFSAEAQIASMLKVEAALARAEAAVGIIPASAADLISKTVERIQVDPYMISEGMARDGVPVPALAAAMREGVGPEAAPYVHWGATSQDIIDTAWVLRVRESLSKLSTKLNALISIFARLADQHRGTIMVARTRSQQATPTTLGLKIAGWGMPLIRQRKRLAELQSRLLVVQFGGASGTLAALGDRGIAVTKALAAELDLSVPPTPWHSQRDNVAELAGWLAILSGSLGKFGRDLVLLSQSEIAEVRAGVGGGSSTMPQKSNPIGAETLVSLARLNAGLLGNVHQAILHEHERDGASWQLEWLTLPQMLVAAGAALRHSVDLADNLIIDKERMQTQLVTSQGLILAEAATFALADHMPRPEAQALVKSACAEVDTKKRHLMDILQEKSNAPVDWQALKDPGRYLGMSSELIDRMIREAGKST